MDDASDFTIQGNKLTAYNGAGGSVAIPDGVEIIGTGAFKNKTAVTSVSIPGTVQLIETEAFAGSGLTSVAIPDSVLSLGFKNGSSGTVDDGRVYSSEWTGAFANCANLTSVTFGSGLSAIAPNAFRNCAKLASAQIPQNVTGIGTAAFYGCASLASVSLPSGLLSLGNGAFAKTGLTSVSVPGSVSAIGGNYDLANNRIASKDSVHYTSGSYGYYYNRVAGGRDAGACRDRGPRKRDEQSRHVVVKRPCSRNGRGRAGDGRKRRRRHNHRDDGGRQYGRQLPDCRVWRRSGRELRHNLRGRHADGRVAGGAVAEQRGAGARFLAGRARVRG
jgi:hypothetical protein